MKPEPTTSTTRGASPAGDPEDLLFVPTAQATPETSFSAGDETGSKEAWGASGQWAQRAEDVIVDSIERSAPVTATEQPSEPTSLRLRDEVPAAAEDEPLMVQRAWVEPPMPAPAPLETPRVARTAAYQASRPNVMAVPPAGATSRPRPRPPVMPVRVVGAPRSEPLGPPVHLRPRPQPTIAGLCIAVAILLAGWAGAAWLWMGVGSVPLAIMSGTLGTIGAVMSFVLGSR